MPVFYASYSILPSSTTLEKVLPKRIRSYSPLLSLGTGRFRRWTWVGGKRNLIHYRVSKQIFKKLTNKGISRYYLEKP